MKRAVLIAGLLLVGFGCKKADPPASSSKPPPVQTGSAVGSGSATGSAIIEASGSGSAGSGSAGSGSAGSGSAGSGSAGSAAPVPEEDSWASPAMQKDPIKKPFLWSVEKGGNTSYLLGTIHIGVDAEKRLPDVVFQKLDAAKSFAMETDTTDPAIAGMGKRTSGTLREDLGPVYWKKLEAVIGANVAQAIDGMKPMIAATVVSLRGLPTTPPMDGVLHGRATRKKKQIVFLETAASQAAVLEKHMTVRALKIMLDDPEKGTEQTKRMLDAYIAGDDATFIKLTNEQRSDAIKAGYTAAEYEEFMDDINYKRNEKWIPALEKLHAEGPAFVAVGALHLIGKRSVIDLLERKGYKITRIAP